MGKHDSNIKFRTHEYFSGIFGTPDAMHVLFIYAKLSNIQIDATNIHIDERLMDY